MTGILDPRMSASQFWTPRAQAMQPPRPMPVPMTAAMMGEPVNVSPAAPAGVPMTAGMMGEPASMPPGGTGPMPPQQTPMTAQQLAGPAVHPMARSILEPYVPKNILNFVFGQN